jgi:hypothetical protein
MSVQQYGFAFDLHTKPGRAPGLGPEVVMFDVSSDVETGMQLTMVHSCYV